jgi:hypothetical protein
LGALINDARNVYNSLVISLNGWDVPLGTVWVTTGAAESLQNTITAAEDAFNGPDLTDYDFCLLPLSDLQQKFINGYFNNPSGMKYDYSGLQSAIAAAEDAISPANFAVSADGMNVPGTKKWTSQTALDAFKQKITAARDVIIQYGEHGQNVAGATVNQGVITAAAGTLTSQLTTFNGTLLSGYMPNYSLLPPSLTAEIATANNLLYTTAVSADGSNVPSGAQWTSQTVWDALKSAVTAAQAFVDNNEGAITNILSANQTNVTNQYNTLNAAVSAFNSGVGTGSGSPLLYNYLVLNAAVADAQAALASITRDATATGNNVSTDSLWATSNYWDPLNTLVLAQTQGSSLQIQFGPAAVDAAAQTANQTAINNAAAALVSATATLRANAQSGCKPDYTQLNGLIQTALTDLTATPASLDGYEYATSDFWVLPAERTALQNAINAAKAHVTTNDLAIHGNWIDNQNAVDGVYSDLGAAYTLFLTQRKAGDEYDPADASFTGLPALISAADALLDSDSDGTADVVSSASSGADVAYGTYWLAVNDHTTLTTHLTLARNMVFTPASYSKTAIANTFTSLSTAVTATRQNGRGANPAELDDEIAAAELLKAALDAGDVVTSSLSGTDVVYGTQWVTSTVAAALTTALTNAQSASGAAPPALHTSVIVPLESALRSATAAFLPQLNPPYNAAPDMAALADSCARISAVVNALAASAHNGLDVLSSVMWVPAGAKSTLQAAILAAGTASYPTHADVLDEVNSLKASLTALLAMQAPGSKPSYIVATSWQLPNGFVGAVYNAQVVDATLSDIAFNIAGGVLPDGLSLDASSTGITPGGTGKLVGKPTRAGTFTFTIEATHNTMIPVVTETLSHTIKIYDAPAIVPTEYSILDADLVSVFSDIVIRFPSGTPMNTTAGTVTLNDHPQTGGYWSTDTTFILPSPVRGYEYETDYTFAIVGFESKDGLLTYSSSYTFRTRNTPPSPNIPRSVTLQPLPSDVTSDRFPGQYWTGVDDKYNFTFALTVPPDKIPTVTTNRIVNGEAETLSGVPDPDMPETRFLFTVRQIHQAIEISVSLSPRRSVDNGTVGDGVLIRAAGGKLYVETPQPGLLSVYSVAGAIHARKTLVGGSSAIPLPKGIYIVHLNGKIYKVAVL